MKAVKKIEWTPDKIAFFWDTYTQIPGNEDKYFTKMVGDGLLRFVSRQTALTGEICDYGAGRGFLTEKLLAKPGALVSACDFSEASVAELRQRFESHPQFRSGYQLGSLPSTDIPSAAFDVLFFVEAVEHIHEDELDATLLELLRILKPGGRIVVTTPNDEDLRRSHVICPNCAVEFHAVQHLRSFTDASLGTLMERAGFRTQSVQAIRPLLWQGPRMGLRYAADIVKTVAGQTAPTLVYIGTKPM